MQSDTQGTRSVEISKTSVEASRTDGNVDWLKSYKRRLHVVDALAILWATSGAYVIRFQTNVFGEIPGGSGPYLLATLTLAVTWWVFLVAWGTREASVLGSGAEEYRAVANSSFSLFGLIAILSYAFQYDTARGFVGLALPAGLISLLFGRWVVRQWIRAERAQGRSSSQILVIGGPRAASHLVRSLVSKPEAGYRPIGAYLVGYEGSHLDSDLDTPVVGYAPSIDGILSAIELCNADSVAISSGSKLSPMELRSLGWELAARQVRLILAPALTDVAGPRIHTQPVAGLPLIHVSTPKLTGPRRVVKRSFDFVTSLFLLLLLLPVLAVIAVLVKLSGPGPIFYTQERIGIRGESFNMVKFRSMNQNADAELSRLLAAQGSVDQPLFKVTNDPRITKVGSYLRKYSLDELPQLFNVLSGSMSLVGPRPQREGEVVLYDDSAKRRLFVRPGMSGLWQVSGRSNLSWEQAVRLDLYYVENWSLTQDIIILFRTFKAVFSSSGAV